MGMVVRTNTMALNAYRQLGMNNSAVSKSLEKLSSGFRINRAGDDAAGLAISEKMKAQITGLETASANAQDGISLIQTAEGNLNEVHSMLNRMVELATKSANGTYTSQERQALQDEVDSLLSEIDRISQSANFNGTKLLNGTMGLNNEGFEIGTPSAATTAGTKVITSGVTVDAAHSSGEATEVKPKFTVNFAEYAAKATANVTGNAGSVDIGFKVDVNGTLTDVEFVEAGAWATAKTVNATADTDLDITAGTLSGLFAANDLVKIGDDVFKVTAKTADVIEFTWEGTANTDGTADTTATVSDTTWVPSGAFTVTATGDGTDINADVVIDPNKRADCAVTKVDDPVVGADAKRAGAGLTLTADMVKDGAKLKIGDTTFTFSTSAAANGTQANDGDDVTISIKGVKEEDLLQYVTEQLSNFTAKATHTAADGTTTTSTFAINREGTDKIHIDEDQTAGNYAGFTETELKNVFQQVTEASNAKITLTVKDNDKLADEESILVDGTEYKFAKGDDAAATLNNLKTALGSNYDVTVNDDVVTIAAKTATADAPVLAGSGLTLQIGDTADNFNKMTVKVNDMSTNGLGLKGLSIMNETSASAAIDKVKTAINTVSTARAGMGALQNRLEHTINNLDVAVENLSAANSRIRDTDMAKEMMNYTKMNVLVQSAQAMLAQANQQPQSVLQLLQ